MAHSCLIAVLTTVLISSIFLTKAQISTPCTTSVISTFTPCLNFVTGSTGTGSSPTSDCCDSLKSLMTNNVDCACLIVTGNVPVTIPFVNANLAISLSGACKSSVPLQCKASGVPLPPPGPVLFVPPPPPPPPPHAPSPVSTQGFAPGPSPAHGHGHDPVPAPLSHNSKDSKAVDVVAPPPAESLDSVPVPSSPKFSLGPTANPGMRPVVNHPNSAATLFVASLPSLLIFVGIIAFKFF